MCLLKFIHAKTDSLNNMRKYDTYEVASNQPGEESTFCNYRDALSLYMHIKQSYSDAKVTLYGRDEMLNYTVIMSYDYERK